jgi:alpha-D-glucose phosphate-specific phosphoglucomutase
VCTRPSSDRLAVEISLSCRDCQRRRPINTVIKFGTDGWRARIAEDFTFDNVRLCAQAFADYLNKSGLASRGLIVGYDTRFASEDFAAAVAEVAAGNGIRTFLSNTASPTPVVSYATMARKAGGAVIITASHNPGSWNGFKIKSENGTSAPPEVTTEVEKNLQNLGSGQIKRLPLSNALNSGVVERLDLSPIYFEQVRRLIDIDSLRDAPLKVVVDPMHGAGSGFLTTLLKGGKMVLSQTQDERNPIFPGMERPEPIAQNLKELSAAVRRRKASVGLATDGDADRFGAVDERGVFITTLQMYALLCLYLLEVRGERGLIVRTITTTAMLDRLGEIFRVPVRETPVGFKWVAPIMMSENALIGGEESGGYGFRGHVIERDGILASLYFLDFLAKSKRTPSQLIEYLYAKVGPHHFDREDVEFPEADRQKIMDRVKAARPGSLGNVKVSRIETNDGFRFVLADTSWLLVRFSGTEPLLRFYAEASSPARVREMLHIGRKMADV